MTVFKKMPKHDRATLAAIIVFFVINTCLVMGAHLLLGKVAVMQSDINMNNLIILLIMTSYVLISSFFAAILIRFNSANYAIASHEHPSSCGERIIQ